MLNRRTTAGVSPQNGLSEVPRDGAGVSTRTGRASRQPAGRQWWRRRGATRRRAPPPGGRFGGMLPLVNLKLPPGLEPAPTNSLTVAAEVGSLLVIELDGGRVYLDDSGNLFALPAHVVIRDRLVDCRRRLIWARGWPQEPRTRVEYPLSPSSAGKSRLGPLSAGDRR